VQSVPTLATVLKAKGFKTAAFVGAFPLDHQFGLSRGFDVYSDRLGRDATGRLANERPAAQVVDEAIAWLEIPDRRPAHLPYLPSSCGSTSSIHTRRTATRPTAGQAGCWIGTTKTSRPLTARRAAC
jgi:hypothetical protein